VSAGHDDFAVEPVRGLPEKLPEGEHILWQGVPDWRVLARTAFHTHAVAGYFALLMAWRAGANYAKTQDMAQAAISASALLPLAALAIALLLGLAWATSRGTVYTITNKRVAMRIGLALTKTLNLPFAAVASADLALRPGNNGDLVLKMRENPRLGWFHIWPHARPWRLREPEPMLRAVADAPHVAMLLASALREAARLRGESVAPVPTIQVQPAANDMVPDRPLVPAAAAE
jgi:hypothetical protein